ncbi:histidine ammonia-lyase [Proteiniclasticum sp. QWL-01]|uniref:histidine ammonia-lyase n=1 Tax=Proteiniclasticum sp. QWL-01 TaxID=3036945 RepID=UPI00240F6404|nr:histidine ammonia-lyase [Proteiniclasticum sp. QWL-01]WFF71718.1 histidine ammonia-lyase [Proteiniclasticum sp. QWL-01]
MEKLLLDGSSLTIEDFISVTRGMRKVGLTDASKQAVLKARELVDRFVSEHRVVYGLTTGFGKFSDVSIDQDETEALQRNLITSHCCGVGEPFPADIVRGIILLRVNALSKGFSGIRLETLESLIGMLNENVVPYVPEKGSLGASGDLAPLSHVALTLIGQGQAYYQGELMDGAEAMKKAGVPIITLSSKEGLALNNGTQVMTSVGTHTIWDAFNLIRQANGIAMLSFEALTGITDAYFEGTHKIRNQAGQVSCAKNFLELVEGSANTTKQGELRVQDAYSLRCLPQIHGASLDCFNYVRSKVENEINAVTDNPIIFVDEERVVSGGNFHGQPMALPFDFLKIGLAELANVSERRVERLVNPALSNGLPAFLTERGGVNSGFMIVQYSAASLVSENKVLAHPASVDSIPSSANQEDHVSMGTIAARQAREILGNTRKVLAMELLTACQALDLRGNKGLGKGTQAFYDKARSVVDTLGEDRVMYYDIDKMEKLIESNELVKALDELQITLN